MPYGFGVMLQKRVLVWTPNSKSRFHGNSPKCRLAESRKPQKAHLHMMIVQYTKFHCAMPYGFGVLLRKRVVVWTQNSKSRFHGNGQNVESQKVENPKRHISI